MIDGQRERSRYWSSAREVTPEVLRQAQAIPFTLNPGERSSAVLHSLRLDQPENATLYVRIRAGLESRGEFVMSRAHDTLVRVPSYPKEAKIAQAGALLPRSGSGRLALIGRGVSTLRLDIARVQSDAVHHLASQTAGDIRSAHFSNYRFDEDNIVERQVRYLDLAPEHPSRAAFTHYDLSQHLADGGLYVVTVQGWNRSGAHAVGSRDRRLLLISDIGLLVKANRDDSQAVFLHGIARR